MARSAQIALGGLAGADAMQAAPVAPRNDPHAAQAADAAVASLLVEQEQSPAIASAAAQSEPAYPSIAAGGLGYHQPGQAGAPAGYPGENPYAPVPHPGGQFGEPAGVPGAPDLNPQWKTPHRSAQLWAEKRRGALSGQIRRRPRPQAVAVGLLIAGFAAWMVISYLPSHRPMSTGQLARLELQAGADVSVWRLVPHKYRLAQLACGGLMLVGLIVAGRGALFRPRRRLRCRVCNGDVVAEARRFKFTCTNGSHTARRRVLPFVLMLAFSSFATTLLVVIVSGVLGNAGAPPG